MTVTEAPRADAVEAAAAVLGAVFIGAVTALRRQPTPARAMRVFAYSITYVTLLFGALALDTLAAHGL